MWPSKRLVFLGTYLNGGITGSGSQDSSNDEETEWSTRDIYTPTDLCLRLTEQSRADRAEGAETQGD